MIVYTNGRGMSRGKLKIEDGKWRMNDTVYGVSPGLAVHEMHTAGC
jgi:hypothetical protein